SKSRSHHADSIPREPIHEPYQADRSGKMPPSSSLERLRPPGGQQRHAGQPFPHRQNATHTRNRYAGDYPREPRRGPRRKEQFVILAAMERLVETRPRPNWQREYVDLRRHARLFADVHEVRRKSIADVDGRRGQLPPHEPPPLGKPRLRI